MKAHAYCENEQCFVEGDLDFSTVTKLWEESLPIIASMRELKFNLSKINFANSAAMALLIEWVKYAKKANKNITFLAVPDSITSLAKISGTEDFLRISIPA